jgi:hypothetical protein
MQDTTKESRQAAESDRQRRLRAAGFRSTVLTNYMPANSPAMKQFMGN